ncbi:hypothetical protein Y033_5887 [Burkholderia pseudomallei MSHR435]|nr:hypothetical protein Y033_5887 [Burkholderia pseudomallei MSHR435]
MPAGALAPDCAPGESTSSLQPATSAAHATRAAARRRRRKRKGNGIGIFPVLFPLSRGWRERRMRRRPDIQRVRVSKGNVTEE